MLRGSAGRRGCGSSGLQAPSLRYYGMLSAVIPPLEPTTGALPLGRWGCTTAELEQQFVNDDMFAGSSTRRQILGDWFQAKSMLDSLSPDLIECAWLGGSFVTAKLDPDDIDSMFILSGEAFDALPSNGKRGQVMDFNVKDKLRLKTGLRVEAFVFVRHAHAMPWSRGSTVDPALAPEFAIRGAWDDWWLRDRAGPKGNLPTVADAKPVRGYLEVRWT